MGYPAEGGYATSEYATTPYAGCYTQQGAAALAGNGELLASNINDGFGGYATKQYATEKYAGDTGATWRRDMDPALAGAGTLGATGTIKKVGSVALAGAGTLAATALRKVEPSVALSGVGALGATALRRAEASVALVGAGTLAVTGLRKTGTTVALAGAGTLDATGLVYREGQVTLGGTGILTAVSGGPPAPPIDTGHGGGGGELGPYRPRKKRPRRPLYSPIPVPPTIEPRKAWGYVTLHEFSHVQAGATTVKLGGAPLVFGGALESVPYAFDETEDILLLASLILN